MNIKHTIALAGALALVSGAAFAADEVKIMEYDKPATYSTGQIVPIHGAHITTQELDIAVESSTTNAGADYVTIHCTVDCWIDIGETPSAVVGSSIFQGAGTSVEYPVKGGTDKIDTAADA